MAATAVGSRWPSSGRVTDAVAPGLSGDLEPKFATLPFHLSFQRLYELINDAMGHGEDLTAALSRLQRGGEREVSPLLHTLHRLTNDQLHTLEMLLGQRFEIASDTSSSRRRPHVARVGARARRFVVGARSVAKTFRPGRSGAKHMSSGGFANGNAGTLSSGAMGSELLASGAFGSESLSSFTAGPNSEAWRLAGKHRSGVGVGSDTMDSERAMVFRDAVEKELGRALGPLFSGFSSPGGSDGFSAGAW